MAHRFQNGTTLRERMLHAWRRWQLIHGEELSQIRLGEMVGEHLSGKAIHPSRVSRWFKGEVEPDLRSVCAIAKALEVDPGWLAFGQDSEAPAPSMILQPPDGSFTPLEKKD